MHFVQGQPAELNFVRRQGDGVVEPAINTVIFRQNTECLYCGVEWTNPPPDVRAALATHPRMKPFKNVKGEDLAISLRIFTRGACQRIATAAFEYARSSDTSRLRYARSPMSCARRPG